MKKYYFDDGYVCQCENLSGAEIADQELVKAYVDKYCIKHNITVDQALEHYLVKDAAEYYLENR